MSSAVNSSTDATSTGMPSRSACRCIRYELAVMPPSTRNRIGAFRQNGCHRLDHVGDSLRDAIERRPHHVRWSARLRSARPPQPGRRAATMAPPSPVSAGRTLTPGRVGDAPSHASDRGCVRDQAHAVAKPIDHRAGRKDPALQDGGRPLGRGRVSGQGPGDGPFEICHRIPVTPELASTKTPVPYVALMVPGRTRRVLPRPLADHMPSPSARARRAIVDPPSAQGRRPSRPAWARTPRRSRTSRGGGRSQAQGVEAQKLRPRRGRCVRSPVTSVQTRRQPRIHRPEAQPILGRRPSALRRCARAARRACLRSSRGRAAGPSAPESTPSSPDGTKTLDDRERAPALPADRRSEGPAILGIPGNDRLALVGEPGSHDALRAADLLEHAAPRTRRRNRRSPPGPARPIPVQDASVSSRMLELATGRRLRSKAIARVDVVPLVDRQQRGPRSRVDLPPGDRPARDRHWRAGPRPGVAGCRA